MSRTIKRKILAILFILMMIGIACATIVVAQMDPGTPFEEPECKDGGDPDDFANFKMNPGTPFEDEEPECKEGGDPDEVFVY
ncbi:MAG: hypothetical protein V1726_07280 [Methanobacteriota archaeon]